MRSLGLVVLCACDSLFGIRDTHLTHDLPVDAPFACPTSGPPVFSHALQQLVELDCRSFTAAELGGLAAMWCSGGDFGVDASSVLVVGSLENGQDMTVIEMTNFLYLDVIIDPEGDEIFTFTQETNYVVGELARTGTTWAPGTPPALPFIWNGSDDVTSPTKRPDRRMLYYRWAPDLMWYELQETAPGTWITERAHPELGPYLENPRLTADGLHLVGNSGTDTIVYAGRTSLGGDFDPPVQITTVPAAGRYPSLTDNCSRLYFWGLNSVFYAQQ
jgi:hypothetical protein